MKFPIKWIIVYIYIEVIFEEILLKPKETKSVPLYFMIFPFLFFIEANLIIILCHSSRLFKQQETNYNT